MKIALATIYGDVYARDRIFDPASCTIGENLLEPGIRLKKYLEEQGHEFHTIDCYEKGQADKVIFQDIGPDYWIALKDPVRIAKYILKRKWRRDPYLIAGTKLAPDQRILIMQEPPVVNPWSYDRKLHSHFGTILTWDDDLVDNERYFKFCYPQVIPKEQYQAPFTEKKFLTMICGNKTSDHEKELYSARRAVIDYFENREDNFDLYGFGWEKERLKSYRGTVVRKLETLSRYRFSICYENMRDVKGYITEKIFDCFFAGVVPVYWGAENVTDFIPEDALIDRRKFRGMDELVSFLKGMTEEEYNRYISTAEEYLHSRQFHDWFSVDAYIGRICKAVFGMKKGLA